MKNLVQSQSAITSFLDHDGDVRATIDVEGYRITPTLPAGGHLGKTYFHAVLTAAGMLTIGRKGAPDMAITGSYDTATAIKHHEKAGNLVRVKGGYRLTTKGLNAMHDRMAKAKDKGGFDSAKIDQLVEFINGETKGMLPDWIPAKYKPFQTMYKRFK